MRRLDVWYAFQAKKRRLTDNVIRNQYLFKITLHINYYHTLTTQLYTIYVIILSLRLLRGS